MMSAYKPASPSTSSTIHDNRKTKYSDLKMPSQEEELVNFYGVIVDASMPMKTASQKFVTTLKIIDPTMYSTGNEPNVNFAHATAIIYAKRIEDSPFVNNIGDIIRIHRANYKLWKDRP